MRVPIVFALFLAGCSASSYRTGASRPSYAAGPEGLRAGVIDDHDRIGDYVAYVDSVPRPDLPKVDLSDRRILTFTAADGTPLWDEPVRLESGGRIALETRTNAKGEVLFAPGALGLARWSPVTAIFGRRNAAVAVAPDEDVVVVPNDRPYSGESFGLDVALCVDTTSSMDDEVERLRTSLLDVVRRIGAGSPGVRLRIGGVAYRDVGDAYVTKPFDFTTDVNEAARAVASLRTEGGGDHHEAVNEALEASLSRLSWTRNAAAVRLLFLIGDAGPHVERGPDSVEIARRATSQGIQIVPIGCSGLDDVGEFVWRQLAALTLGKFLFVSYGGSTDHHVGGYEENDLDELMVRSVAEAVEAVKHPVRRFPAPRPAPAPWPPYAVAPQDAGQGAAPWFTPRRGPSQGYGRSPVDFGYRR